VNVLHISTARGKPRSHRSLIQDTARAPRISTYAASPEGEKGVHVCALEEGDTWMTPYRRYIANGILLAEPGEGKKIKKNSARYTLVDGVLFRPVDLGRLCAQPHPSARDSFPLVTYGFLQRRTKGRPSGRLHSDAQVS